MDDSVKKLNVSSNPHIRSSNSTRRIMLTVVIALLVPALFGVWHFGPRAFFVLLVSVVSCVVSEFVGDKLLRRENTVGDLSAVVTGLLLGMNLPPSVPLYLPVLGGVFAIIVVKLLFGGLGQNIMNPALAARAFLVISFAGKMTDFSTDTMSGPTPLTALKQGLDVDTFRMVWGGTSGCIGETSVIAICVGAIIMILAGVIDLKIPFSYIFSFALFYIIFSGYGLDMYRLTAQLSGGGLMLGAFFMATDYVTSPITTKGKIFYGILLGVLTGIFRVFGSSAEGVSYAIIISNLLVPVIDSYTIKTPFGYSGREKA